MVLAYLGVLLCMGLNGCLGSKVSEDAKLKTRVSELVKRNKNGQ